MAQVIIPGIAAAVSAGTATAGQLLIFGAVNLGVSAVASYALNALTPKPKIPGSGGFLVNEVNPTAPAEYVYGEVRKGGIVTYDEATDDNAILHRIIVLAAGEHEVGDIYLNDEVVSLSDSSYDVTDPSDPSDVYTGAGWVITEKWMEDNRIREPRIRIFVHDGSQTATTDTFANSSTATLANTLLASTANGLDSNFVGKGLTYLYVQMNIDAEVFAGGIPRITAKLKRKGVYDPRDDTSKITSNWALCVADYLQASYGLGDTGSVDNTALSAEANLCDEAVTLGAGGTQPRYELNGVFRSDETPGQILSRMMPSGSGQLFWGQGKWNIRAGEYAGSIASFDLSDLRSAIQVETRTPRAQNYNAVRGVFNDKSQRYIEGEYPRISSATFLSVDGGFENVLDYDLPFETDGTRAQRLAKLALYRQREQIRVEADFNMRAASVQPGDVIDLTIARYGWTNKEFEVVGWTLKISETGTLCVRLSLKETSEAAFDWNAEESTFESNNTNLPDRFAVGSVSLGTPVLSKIDNPEGAALTLVTVPWSVTSPGLIADYVFEWRENAIDYAANGGFVADSGSFTARQRAVYDAYLKGLRRAPDQNGFDFYVSGGGSALTPEAVLIQITNSTEGQNQAVFQSVVTRNTSYELRTLKYGQRYDFRVYARNARGIRSDASALTYLVETDNTVPKAPASFTATAAYQAVNLAWAAVTQNTDNSTLDDLYQYNVYRNTSNSFGGATLIAELPKNTLKYADAGLDNATLYYYWVTARDFSGNESAYSNNASTATNAELVDGTSPVSAFLTNESHTVTADFDGSNPDLSGAVTDMRVFIGDDEDTSNWSFSRSNSTGIASTISGNTVTVISMFVDEGYVDITASKSGFASLTKRFTLSKSKAGADGTPAKLLTLSATGQVFTFDGAGDPDPSSQTITFTATLQSTDDTTATWSTSPSVSLGGSGNTRTLSVAAFGANTAVTVTASADSGAVLDRITVYRVKDGADGVDGDPGAAGTDGDRTYTGTVYYTALQAGSPGLPSETSVTFNESTGTFTGGTFSATPGWRHTQPSVDITDTSLLEWECQYRVTVSGALSFPQTAVPNTEFSFSALTSAIQVTTNIESDNFNGVIDTNGDITDPGTAGWAITRDGGNAVFNDLIARGTMQSSTFTSGSAGWEINQDGSAEFNNVTVRGDVDMTGGDIDILDTLATPPITVGVRLNPGTASANAATETTDALELYRHASARYCIDAINYNGTALRVIANGLSPTSPSGTGDGIYVENRGTSGSTCIDAVSTRSDGATGPGLCQIALSGYDGGYGLFIPAGSENGGLDGSGNGFSPFTGTHMGMLLKTAACVPGDILIDHSIVVSAISDSFGEVTLSSSINQAGAIGVLQKRKGGWIVPPAFVDRPATKAAQAAAPEGVKVDPVLLVDPSAYHEDYDLVDINAVGEGAINVCGENGDIAKGDLIVTSSTPGKGMKQADDIVRSYTVAKAREDVTFSGPDDIKLVACIYLCG